MSEQWHYSNDGQQQFGPVPEEQLRAMIAQGRVRPEHLVWKDGLASWTRVDASELRAALPRSGAPTPQVQASQPQPRTSSKLWIGVAIGVAVLVVLPITAAIVVPAYQDYVARSQVAEAVTLAAGAEVTVSEFLANNERCPTSNAEAGLAEPAEMGGKYVEGLTVRAGTNGNCFIVARLKDKAPVAAAARNLVIVVTYDAATQQWSCASEVFKLIPAVCRLPMPDMSSLQPATKHAAMRPTPQAPSSLPTSSTTSPVPRQASDPLTNGTPVANTGTLKIEKRTIVDKNDKLDIDVAYPHTGIAAIDDEIEAWVRGEVGNIRKEHADPDSAHSSGWNLAIGYNVERNDEKLVAFVLGESSYTGGAHGFSQNIVFNYLMPDGHRVDLPNILDANALALVSSLVITDLKRQSHANDDSLPDEMIEDGAGPKWQNFSAFTWLPGELHVFFAPYQVGPYSAGQQEVRIPLAKLQGLIRPDWRAPPPQQAQASPSAQPISQSAASPLPSFDCTKAATFIEKEICRDPALAKLDAALSQNWTAMNAANIGSSAKHDLLVTQRVWLSSRDQCTDNTCLRAAYRKRIDAICDYPVIAGVHPDCVMADSIANADASPLSPPIAARDWKLALNENGAIITSQALGTTVYLGKSCDAQSPQYGTGHWQWNDAGWEVDVGNQRLAFPRGKPPISPPEDAPTKCKSE